MTEWTTNIDKTVGVRNFQVDDDRHLDGVLFKGHWYDVDLSKFGVPEDAISIVASIKIVIRPLIGQTYGTELIIASGDPEAQKPERPDFDEAFIHIYSPSNNIYVRREQYTLPVYSNSISLYLFTSLPTASDIDKRTLNMPFLKVNFSVVGYQR